MTGRQARWTGSVARVRAGGNWSGCLRLLLVVLLCALFTENARATGPGQRQKPGPVTLRGIATDLTSNGFVLRTNTRGTYSVQVLRATHVIERGVKGRVALLNGDHVGVRGFVAGRKIRAITIRIYPIKPKPFTIRGTVRSAQPGYIVVVSGKKIVNCKIGPSTAIVIGAYMGSAAEIRSGARVDVRAVEAGTALVALRIHVYRSASSGTHVALHGTLTSVSADFIVVKTAGGSYRVTMAPGASIYLGIKRAGRDLLRVGQTVTVRACCTGRPLALISVRVSSSVPARSMIDVRGQVVWLSASRLVLATPAGKITISLSGSTAYEVGASRVARGGIQRGDAVSVRATRSGGALLAVQVHVYVASRHVRSITGIAVSVSSRSMVLSSRGRRYALAIPGGTRQVRPGDRVQVKAHNVNGVLTALIVTSRHPALKSVSVSGAVVWIQGRTVMLADSSGVRHRVMLPNAASIRLAGRPAPPSALFPGVHLRVRGTMANGTLQATSATISVRSRSVKGRVTAVSSGSFSLREATGTSVRVDLAGHPTIVDPAVRTRSISVQVGALVSVKGYEETATRIRATSVLVTHPTLSFSGAVSGVTGGLTVTTADGERYLLHVSSSTAISSGRITLTLTIADIVVGDRVHVQGTIQSDGSVAVQKLTVHLAAATVRGTVSSIDAHELLVQAPTGPVHARLLPGALFLQGTRQITVNDVVAGDDVTVYGYVEGPATVLTRKVSVHRKLTGIDGTVAALGSGGFTISAIDGPHRVISGADTLYVGATGVAIGASVHVTGYLRGDGAILATRVRVNKGKSVLVRWDVH